MVDQRHMKLNDVASNPLGFDRLHVFNIVSVRFRPERYELVHDATVVSAVNSRVFSYARQHNTGNHEGNSRCRCGAAS